jgi:hypothetical protein
MPDPITGVNAVSKTATASSENSGWAGWRRPMWPTIYFTRTRAR